MDDDSLKEKLDDEKGEFEIAEKIRNSTDPYEILFLQKNNPLTENMVKKRYRKISIVFHPDKKIEHSNIFMKITNARDKLLDINKKPKKIFDVKLYELRRSIYKYEDIPSKTFLEKFNYQTFSTNIDSWKSKLPDASHVNDEIAVYEHILIYRENESKNAIFSEFMDFMRVNNVYKKITELNANLDMKSIEVSLLVNTEMLSVEDKDHVFNALLDFYDKYCTIGNCSPFKNGFIDDAYNESLFIKKDKSFFKEIFNKLVAKLIVFVTYYTLMKFHDEPVESIDKIIFKNYDNLDHCIKEYKTYIDNRTKICKTVVVAKFKTNEIFKKKSDDDILLIYNDNVGSQSSPIIEDFQISNPSAYTEKKSSFFDIIIKNSSKTTHTTSITKMKKEEPELKKEEPSFFENHKGKMATAALLGVGLFAYNRYNTKKKKDSIKSGNRITSKSGKKITSKSGSCSSSRSHRHSSRSKSLIP